MGAGLKGRGEAIRRGLAARRDKMAIEKAWHPCLWCAKPIGLDRVKDALLRGQQPAWCSEPCRKNEPGFSLVVSIFSSSLGASKTDESAWQAEFDQRIAAATAPFTPQRKGRTK